MHRCLCVTVRSAPLTQRYCACRRYYNASGADGLEKDANSSTYVQIGIYLYVFIGLLWTIELVSGVNYTALSGSVSHWYFFRDDTKGTTRAPLARSLGRVLFYHLGSIAFGAFIIAVVKLVRYVLMTIDKYTKERQKNNLLLRLVMKCCICCLWCLETTIKPVHVCTYTTCTCHMCMHMCIVSCVWHVYRCLEKTIKFITGYAYIYVALQGSSFCAAAFATFALIMANPAQLAINSLIRSVLGWIQILAVPIGAHHTH